MIAQRADCHMHTMQLRCNVVYAIRYLRSLQKYLNRSTTVFGRTMVVQATTSSTTVQAACTLDTVYCIRFMAATTIETIPISKFVRSLNGRSSELVRWILPTYPHILGLNEFLLSPSVRLV